MEFTLTKHKLWRSCARKLVILGDEVLTLDGNGRTTNKLDLLRLKIEDGPGDTFTIQERAEGACGLPNLLGPRIFHFSAARKPEVLAALHKRDIFAARLSVEPRSGGSSPSAVGAPPVAASPDDAATPRAEAAACLAEAVEAILRPDGSSPGLLGCGLLGAEGLARAEAHNALFRKGLAANASGDSASAASLLFEAARLDPRPTTILSHVNMRLKLGESALAAACYSRLLAEGSLTAKARAIAVSKLAEANAAKEAEEEAEEAEAEPRVSNSVVEEEEQEEEEEEEGGGDAPASLDLVEPFPRPALDAAHEAAAAVRRRRRSLARTAPLLDPAAGRPASAAPSVAGMFGWGEPGAGGGGDAREGCGGAEAVSEQLDHRVDLRARFPRAYAIDGGNTEFRDDAVSIDAASATIGVHIADLSSLVQPGSLLDEVARLRLQSLYAAAAPLHMLPPPLLAAAALSDDAPNECLTALVQLDLYGHIRHCQLVRSLVPPVRCLSFDEVDSLLAGDGMTSEVHSDLTALDAIFQRREDGGARGGAVSARAAGGGSGGAAAAAAAASVRWKGTAGGGLRPEATVHTSARRLVDQALGMYSYAARRAARAANTLRLPQAEHQRVATAPLRRYADLIAQRQLSALLRGEAGMGAGEVAALERWVRQRGGEIRSRLAAQQASARALAGLRELEQVCARQAARSSAGAGSGGAARRRFGSVRFSTLDAVVVKVVRPAEGDTDRRQRVTVRLREVTSLLGHARWGAAPGAPSAGPAGAADGGARRAVPRLAPGRPVRVRVRSVDSASGRLDVDIVGVGRAPRR